MGGGESEKEEDLAELPPCLVGVRLVDAPVLFFVVSHKAFRAEIASLLHLAVEAASSESYDHELVADLGRRFEFLRLVYKYHCVAEDEVIFLALDAQVKNIVPTYLLEHKAIDDNFKSIFHFLDLLMNKTEDIPKTFQNLLICISTIQEIICQHMLKEEKQVFPLLMQKFSSTEQAQLVWRYMCSVPIILLEEFLPWMTSSLSSNEQLDVISCIEVIVPKERLLQEVIVSWLGNSKRSDSDGCSNYGKRPHFYYELSTFEDSLSESKIHSEEQQQKKASSICKNDEQNPIEGIHLWHAAIRRDFNEILEELHQIRSSSSFSSLASVMTQLRFVADVLIFYSISLDQFFNPMPSEVAIHGRSPSGQLIDQSRIEDLQKLLFYELQGTTQLSSFVEILCKKLESFVWGFSKNLIFLEAEVFPIIAKICTREMQLWLLYTGLHKMPLGLLRYAVTWFSAHLTKKESNSLLKNIKLGCPVANNSFALLLREWVHIGCSGKSSVAKFRQDLQELFNDRSYYLTEQIKQDTGFSDTQLKIQLPSKYNSELLALRSAMSMKKSEANPSFSVFNPTEKQDTSYSGVIHLNIFYPQPLSPIQKHLAEYNNANIFLTLESRPMDHILFIHRALIKDMEYLVSLSAKLDADVRLLTEFKKRFHLLHNIYKTHSNSEDEIAFPILESRETLQNVSHSYSIDHKLEAKQFRKISLILNEMSMLHLDVECDQMRPKHHQLCLKLHDRCISMLKVLSDHIYREEVEIFPLFRKFFSIEEQEKMVEHMLGSTKAEYLQQMIPWLMAYLTPNEQQALTSLWRKVAKNTKFDEWLGEWWDGLKRSDVAKVEDGPNSSSLAANPLEVVSMYLLKEGTDSHKNWHDRGNEVLQEEFAFYNSEHSGSLNGDKETCGGQDGFQSLNSTECHSKVDQKRYKETNDPCPDDEPVKKLENCEKLGHQEHPLIMSQDELEATIRRVSRDSALDSQMKAKIIQNLIMSRWMVTQQMSHQEAAVATERGEIPGQSPSYRDPLKLAFGCKHYKRNCKILTPCCNKLHTCIRCHDEATDHSVDRKAVTKMMCMKCLVLQPIGPKCSTLSCESFSMGRYYCRICRLFDDDRKIYHCPYCNLCRVGKGLGIDYFHCMKCNACMSRSLFVHVCREKCLEDNCPICHEYIFTSNSPVKALPCGHLMHSACFQDYTCSHYTCPICSKSLGDMQVYFGMLDALLAEEKIPEEYSGRIQVILCNDCEKRGTVSFHWLYHKCSHCGSYNTRLL
ncbi:zinc finger protein BRUTUS-like At1g74770 isoform X1 [Olea europaea var. sylvestris]|uniref:Zinc finger BRUTUS-like At1g74770 isoform X1 n=1 Tax=Olea europaea subsp. europaea TaxID=158383 RepID=A0A8S0T121_OLEEU|nr:zinc finger protein BRUTUS-like At1g74770 isoform X1 [Olea europaea var. sylvestris]CAA2997772.1 zinc finger BRUTUS-like At1g74770 isoform X1 [Olea europaea subsp. europaea]